MKGTVLAIALLAIASPGFAQATEGPESPGSVSWFEQLGATASLRTGVWSSTRELDGEGPLAAAMFWGKVTRPVTEQVSFLVEGWTALQGPLADGTARAEVREAFVTFASEPLEIRAGRQILAWGRADGINPTDNLTGQDLTLLAPDDSDRRLGAAAVRATYTHRDVSYTAIWLPEFRPHRIPLPPIAGELAASGPEWRPEQFALRVEQTGRAIDWSVSAFSGRDLNPDLGLRASRLDLTHHQVRVLGADAAGNLGRFGLRAEAAYVRTEDEQGRQPFIKNPFLSVVAGADRTYREHMNVNVQYLYRFVADLGLPAPGESPFAEALAGQQAALSGQTRRHSHGASARLSYKWLHDTLEGEIAAAGYARPWGVTLRPKVTYAVSDRIKLLAGGELYRGDAASIFAILRDNSGVFAEARWSF
jgi:hypothetical protein